MSKRWKIFIGVVGILALCLAGMAGVAIGRASTFAAMNRAGIVMQNPRGFDQPDRFEGRGRFDQTPSRDSQVEVKLIDDDEDGIPDRGVVELPIAPGFNRESEGRFNDKSGPPQNFGRGFDSDRDQFNRGQFSRLPFLPVRLLGGLFCLTGLVGLVVLGVVLYRRRSSPSAPSAAAPVETELDDNDGVEDIEPEPEVSDEPPAN